MPRRKFETKADMLAPVPVNQKPWEPKPDMGNIRPDKMIDKVCTNKDCLHKGAMHYGSAKNWCNVGGCNCQAFE